MSNIRNGLGVDFSTKGPLTPLSCLYVVSLPADLSFYVQLHDISTEPGLLVVLRLPISLVSCRVLIFSSPSTCGLNGRILEFVAPFLNDIFLELHGTFRIILLQSLRMHDGIQSGLEFSWFTVFGN